MSPVKWQKWEETLPHGPPLCALCIGNDDYVSSTFGALSSCARDAKAVSAEVHNKLQGAGAWAKVKCNIKDKAALELELQDFLRQIRRPPRMVLVYFSGHGVQEGDKIFLVPTHASPSTVEELRADCLSHDELFRILKTLEERDVPDEGIRVRVDDIVFLVILDTCRSRLGGVRVEESYSAELDPKSPPNVWALCAATSRHREAFENPAISTELSAFTHYLLSEDMGCGLFGLNTPVKGALEALCNKLRERVKGRKQDPTLMGIDRIPSDFCLLCDEAPTRPSDVCVCYRRDTDQEHANFICDKLRIAAPKISLSDAAGMEDTHIASSIAHSKIVVLIVSEKTFRGIDALDSKSTYERPLARLLLQCELIVEIYGLRQERLKVLPICFGVEKDGAGGGRVFAGVDAEALWPANPPSVSVKSIADRAKMLLRADGLQLAQGLHKSNLRIRSRNVASLMSGRHITDTLLVLKEFTKEVLIGRKHQVGQQVSEKIIKLLAAEGGEAAGKSTHGDEERVSGGSNKAARGGDGGLEQRRPWWKRGFFDYYHWGSSSAGEQSSDSKQPGPSAKKQRQDPGVGTSSREREKDRDMEGVRTREQEEDEMREEPLSMSIMTTPQYSPHKKVVDGFNNNRLVDTPLTNSFKILLRGVISRNFGFRLDDKQLQAVADILKDYDGNIRSTSDEKMKNVVLTVIEGSKEELEQKTGGGKGGNALKILKHLMAVYESRTTASQSSRRNDANQNAKASSRQPSSLAPAPSPAVPGRLTEFLQLPRAIEESLGLPRAEEIDGRTEDDYNDEGGWGENAEAFALIKEFVLPKVFELLEKELYDGNDNI